MEQNESVRFRIQITAKDLWMFSMYHSNKGYLGVFNLFFTLASLWLLVTRWSDVTVAYRILLLICVLTGSKEEVGICPHGTGRIHMKMSGFNQLLRQHHNRQVPHRKNRMRCNFQR